MIVRHKEAFSLFELLMVIAIAMILMAMGAASLTNQQAVALDGASKNLAALFDEARAEAMSFGEPVRILIHFTPAEQDLFLRKVLVVQKVDNVKEKSTEEWNLILRPYQTPPGVFFNHQVPGVSTETMEFKESNKQVRNWLYYEIKPNGTISGSQRNFIITQGVIDGHPYPVFQDQEKFAGFRVTNNGRILHYREFSEILP